jgi:tyrosine-protein kinase Etk/Wzc
MQWLENEIARSRTEYAALETRAKSLRASVEEYRATAQTLNTQDSQQKELQRDVKTAEEKYLLYQRKEEEARISDALDQTRIANVAIAEEPIVPVQPRRTRSLLFLPQGFILALLLSVGAALGKDAMSLAIRTPGELQTALGLPVLAWIPARQVSKPVSGIE